MDRNTCRKQAAALIEAVATPVSGQTTLGTGAWLSVHQQRKRLDLAWPIPPSAAMAAGSA